MSVGSNLNLRKSNDVLVEFTRTGELDFQLEITTEEDWARTWISYVDALTVYQWLKKELGQ